MTNRLKGFYVVLESDVREDDAEPILNALRMVKGVLSVDPVETAPVDHFERTRIEMEFREKLWKALEPDKDKK